MLQRIMTNGESKKLIAIYVLGGLEIIISTFVVISNFILGVVYLSNQNSSYILCFSAVAFFILVLCAGVLLIQLKNLGRYLNIGLWGLFASLNIYQSLTIESNMFGYVLSNIPLIIFVLITYYLTRHDIRICFK